MKFFQEENPVIILLGKLFDLMLLNLLTLVCCIPVVTAGASFTAMHYALVHGMEQEEGAIVKSFFGAFRKNFRQATIIWMLLLGMAALLFSAWIVTGGTAGNGLPVTGILIMLAGLLWSMEALYVFPLLARYHNTIPGTLYNAFCMAVTHIPQTGAMLAILVVYAVVFRHHWQTMSSFICLFGLTVPGWLYMKLYLPVLLDMEA